MPTRINSFLSLLLALACFPGPAAVCQQQPASKLKKDLELTIAPLKATVGIAVLDLEDNIEITINNGHHYPMQSVFKFPLALCILNMVDSGKLGLDQPIPVKKEQLLYNTNSPMADDLAHKDAPVSLSKLLEYSVSHSDNNACDILFELAGGTQVLNNYLHKAGIKEIAIVATEAGMHASWPVQYNNWCQPSAMMQLLQKFYQGSLLSPTSNEFLMNLMLNCSTSGNRIRKLLPPGTKVADKSGSSGMNSKGFTAATNDVGIITLPDGRHIILVVFVSDYTGNMGDGEQIIANVAKCVWDHFTSPK